MNRYALALLLWLPACAMYGKPTLVYDDSTIQVIIDEVGDAISMSDCTVYYRVRNLSSDPIEPALQLTFLDKNGNTIGEDVRQYPQIQPHRYAIQRAYVFQQPLCRSRITSVLVKRLG